MALRRIELYGSETLRRPADPVEDIGDEVRALVRDMFETMYDAKGIGLAAPQIGISRRVIVLDVEEESGESNRVALVNPRLATLTAEKGQADGGVPEHSRGGGDRATAGVGRGRRPGPGGDEPCDSRRKASSRAPCSTRSTHLDGVLFIDRLSPLKRQLLLKKYRKLQAEAAEP